MREILFTLLPQDGEHLGFEAARVALSEKIGHDVEVNDLHKVIWQLGSDNRVEWLSNEQQLRRKLPGQLAGPPTTITKEEHIEPWFERYLWLHPTTFYDPLPKSLSIVVENTARKVGSGGRWTRPDLSMACVARYRYLPAPLFDLFSFELKMPSGCNVLAVHEALSHSATAHFAYLCLYLPDGANGLDNLGGMMEQAQRHGVGVIRMLDPRSFPTYTKLLEARRNVPSPAKIDGFVEERFELANRLALRRWVLP